MPEVEQRIIHSRRTKSPSAFLNDRFNEISKLSKSLIYTLERSLFAFFSLWHTSSMCVMPSYVRAKFSRVTISYRILPILDLVWASIALTSNCLLSATTWKFLRRCFLMFLLTFLLHPLLQPVLSLVIVDVSVSICFASLSHRIHI